MRKDLLGILASVSECDAVHYTVTGAVAAVTGLSGITAKTRIDNLTLHNSHTAAVTVEVRVIKSGATEQAYLNNIYKGSIAANETVSLPCPIVLPAGATLKAGADVATKVALHANYSQDA